MPLHYDTVEDAKTKLANSICYYDGKAILVKSILGNDLEPENLKVQFINLEGNQKTVKLLDPLLNYTHFNIGYTNQVCRAVWWYRKPIRQYTQGLRYTQMNYVTSDGSDNEILFQYSTETARMLENVYPTFEECQEKLVEGRSDSIAFHQHFGMSFDNLHDDFIIEYRGRKIGTNPRAHEFKLIKDFRHLSEALTEAIGHV